MKTLVHHDGALGDVLLSLPCINAIKADSSSIHFQGRRDVAELLKQTGCADDVSSSGGAAYASLYAEADANAREFLAGFGRAFVFTAKSDSPPAASIGAVVHRTRIIRTVPPDGAGVPTALYRFAQLFPGPFSPAFPLLRCPREHLDSAHSLIRKAGCAGRILIAVHPGSGGVAKRWRLDRYFELVEKLRKSWRPFFLLFSGPAEGPDMKKQIDRFSLRCDDVLHISDRKLIEAASLLSLCNLYIGNDSGFTHLAAAMGCGVIALFGPTDPALWKPAGPCVEIISPGFSGAVDEITAAAVHEKAVSLRRSIRARIAMPARLAPG